MYYYKFGVHCGFAGTGSEEIIESEVEMTEEELNEWAHEIHIQRCGEYWWEESTKEEFDNQNDN